MHPDHTRRSAAGLIEIEGLRDHIAVYRDRRHAGQVLAHLLAAHVPPALHMFAIPAGGVCVATPIATELGVPLGLVLVSRLPAAPLNDRDADGWERQAASGIRYPSDAGAAHEAEPRVNHEVERLQRDVARLAQRLNGRLRPRLDNGVTLLVDHGLAAGVTMTAAVRAVRRAGAEQVWIAVATAAERTLRNMLPEVECIFCPNVRNSRRFAVADAYERCAEIDEAHTVAHLQNLEDMPLLH